MDLVRAKHPNGGEFTTSKANADRKKLTVVNKPTHDRFGRLIPAKPAANLPRINPDAATRSELEESARKAGLDDAAITGAKTKAELAAAIEAHTSTEEG